MEVFWVPMAELLDAVLDGRVREGPLAQAVLAYDVLRGAVRSRRGSTVPACGVDRTQGGAGGARE